LAAFRAHHDAYVRDIAQQLRAQGYSVRPGGARFYDKKDKGYYTVADLFVKRPDGTPVVFEIKTGGGLNTPNQLDIYPQVANGDAIPSPKVAKWLGVKSGKPLKEVGYPNGIQVFQITTPGL
jgi:filamentous hemagglutinin